MGDLSTYSLSDFILFTDTTYYRLFEIYNQAVWPLHCVAGLLAYLMIYILWKQLNGNHSAYAGKVIAAVLIISWLWVAYAFLYQRFYQIHVVANWYALGFVIQAGLIGWSGLLNDHFIQSGESRRWKNIGMLFVITGTVTYPLIAPLAGRSWLQSEMFAMVPDPTAIVTCGVLLFYRSHIILSVIPITWLLISYTTIYVM